MKPAVTPVGRPEMLRAMLSALPETTAVLMLLLPAAPWATERLAGLALIEKSLVTGDVTVRLSEVVWVAEGAVPVIVSG